jgi:hypothetical protein
VDKILVRPAHPSCDGSGGQRLWTWNPASGPRWTILSLPRPHLCVRPFYHLQFSLRLSTTLNWSLTCLPMRMLDSMDHETSQVSHSCPFQHDVGSPWDHAASFAIPLPRPRANWHPHSTPRRLSPKSSSNVCYATTAPPSHPNRITYCPPRRLRLPPRQSRATFSENEGCGSPTDEKREEEQPPAQARWYRSPHSQAAYQSPQPADPRDVRQVGRVSDGELRACHKHGRYPRRPVATLAVSIIRSTSRHPVNVYAGRSLSSLPSHHSHYLYH